MSAAGMVFGLATLAIIGLLVGVWIIVYALLYAEGERYDAEERHIDVEVEDA